METLETLKNEAKHLMKELAEKRSAVNDGSLMDISKNISLVKRTRMRARKTLKGHIGKIYAIHWSGDSKHLVSASQDGSLLVWHTYFALKIKSIKLKSSWVMACSYAPSGNFVASGGLDNLCTIYNLYPKNGTPKLIRELNGHAAFLSHCRFLDDRRIMTSSGDTTGALWDIDAGIMTTVFKGHFGDIICFDISEENSFMVTCSIDQTAKLWDIRSGKCCQTFYGHEADVNAITLFPSGKAFATASDDKTCRLFDIRSDQDVMVYKSSEVSSTSVAISKSGRILVAGYDDFSSITWDVLKGQRIGVLPGHVSRVSCLGITPDGTGIGTGSWDTSLRVWN